MRQIECGESKVWLTFDCKRKGTCIKKVYGKMKVFWQIHDPWHRQLSANCYSKCFYFEVHCASTKDFCQMDTTYFDIWQKLRVQVQTLSNCIKICSKLNLGQFYHGDSGRNRFSVALGCRKRRLIGTGGGVLQMRVQQWRFHFPADMARKTSLEILPSKKP